MVPGMAFAQSHYKIREDLHFFEIKGRKIPLIVRRHPRARRMILRLNVVGEGAVVTIPAGASSSDAFDLVRRKSSWLDQQLKKIGAHLFKDDEDGKVVYKLIKKDYVNNECNKE